MNAVLLIVAIIVAGGGRMVADGSPRYAGRIGGTLVALAGAALGVYAFVGVFTDGTVSYWLIRAMGYRGG
jgi:hypothetical membrane protein